MVKKKLFSNAEAYAAPMCETLNCKLNEGILILSSGGTNWADNPGGAGGDDNYGDGGNL